MSDLTIFLLMGGQSRRMGQEKAMLLYRGLPFWEQIAKRLAPMGQVVLSVCENRRDFGYPVVPDAVADCGALGAMVSCLQACTTPLAFFCACDMPLLGRELPQLLLSALVPEVQAVIPTEPNGRNHPLCAVYRRELLSLMQKQLAAEDYKLQHFIKLCRTLYRPVTAEQARQLRNINTPEEYAQLLCDSGA